MQGVGFRWRARNAANIYGCTGWCKNEWDGSVSMEIQGTEETIEKETYVKIENMKVREIPLVNHEYTFKTG